jgi:hypothetical protein
MSESLGAPQSSMRRRVLIGQPAKGSEGNESVCANDD